MASKLFNLAIVHSCGAWYTIRHHDDHTSHCLRFMGDVVGGAQSGRPADFKFSQGC